MADTANQRAAFRWVRPQRAFLVIGLVFGQALVLLIPPFQSADEPNHFLRAFQISEGTFVAHQRDTRGSVGGYLPRSIYDSWMPFSRVGFHPETKVSVGSVRAALRIPLRADSRIFFPFPNTARQFPGCYLPQTVGILIGRVFGAGPLVMLYLARECNLMVWIALGHWSLRTAPQIARPLMLVMLMPMTLFVSSSASADVPTNVFAVAFTALVCQQICAREKTIRGARMFFLGLLSAAVSLCKFAYGPLLALLLLIPAKRFGGGKRYWAAIAVMILIDLSLFLMWSSTTEGLDQRINESATVSARAQWSQVLHHPPGFCGAVGESFRMRGWSYLQSYVGLIGWLDRYVPGWFVIGYIGLLLAACFPWDVPAGCRGRGRSRRWSCRQWEVRFSLSRC